MRDPLEAMQRLARWTLVRDDSPAPLVVGITGTVGKTTTKDALATVLRYAGKRVSATAGNFNNEIGLPLTVLAADQRTEILVLEMGPPTLGISSISAAWPRPRSESLPPSHRSTSTLSAASTPSPARKVSWRSLSQRTVPWFHLRPRRRRPQARGGTCAGSPSASRAPVTSQPRILRSARRASASLPTWETVDRGSLSRLRYSSRGTAAGGARRCARARPRPG